VGIVSGVLIALGTIVFCFVPVIGLLEILRCAYLEWRSDRIPILLYHRLISRDRARRGEVRDEEPIYAIHDDTFEAQMRFLRDNGHTTLSLDELLAIREGGRSLPPKSLAITFDDGYESNYTLALPALKRHGHRATIFTVLEPDDYTRRQVEGIDRFLNHDQMRELDRSGVAIESHTVTHCVLSELDEQTARHELAESKRRLSEILGRPVRHLAIPRSGQNRRVLSMAREAGYVTVCGNCKGSSNGWSSLFSLPRIVIERDMSLPDFRRALTPGASLVLRLVGNVKRLPALLLGPSAAVKLRRALYFGPFGRLFITRRLKWLAMSAGVLYLLGSAVFIWYLVTR
jgi:peptidoglycan/xylan/chitin deacetylase (PgdA/CDA1 family)